MSFRRGTDALGEFVDPAVVEARDRVVEDDWSGDAGEACFGEEVRHGEYFLFAFREDLGWFVLPVEDFSALCASLATDKLDVQRGCSPPPIAPGRSSKTLNSPTHSTQTPHHCLHT